MPIHTYTLRETASETAESFGRSEIRVRFQGVEEPPVRMSRATRSYASSWRRLCGRKATTSFTRPMARRRWHGAGGGQIAERCREHDPELHVIYATGFSPLPPRPVPGSLFLQKPYHPKAVVQAVRQVSGGRG
jgi:hypothetical protein